MYIRRVHPPVEPTPPRLRVPHPATGLALGLCYHAALVLWLATHTGLTAGVAWGSFVVTFSACLLWDLSGPRRGHTQARYGLSCAFWGACAVGWSCGWPVHVRASLLVWQASQALWYCADAWRDRRHVELGALAWQTRRHNWRLEVPRA